MSNSSEHAGEQHRKEDSDTGGVSTGKTDDHPLLPSPRDAEDRERPLPERYADDGGPSESVGARVEPGHKRFIEDLVDVHPDFDSTNSLINAWIAELADEHGERVAERRDQIQEARGEF